ncbi:MAG: copper-binding protein [Acidobacteria bacterium]|nr:copper-binding protein [Acidobacteriota bacterium]
MKRRDILLGLTLLAAGCRPGKQQKFDYGEPKQKYTVRGVVLGLRPESRVAVLKHEKIEGWMEPMTMECPVPSAEEFAKLKEGATIRATVNVNDMYFWLTAITVE